METAVYVASIFIGAIVLFVLILYNMRGIYLRKPLNPFLRNRDSKVEILESYVGYESIETDIEGRFRTHCELKRWHTPHEKYKMMYYIEVRGWL